MTTDDFTQLLKEFNSYQAYLEFFKNTLDEKCWRGTEQKDTISAYQNYLELYPSGLSHRQAEERIAFRPLIEWADKNNIATDKLPREITRLQNLTYLYLGKSQLTTLPESISKLTTLTELYLGGINSPCYLNRLVS